MLRLITYGIKSYNVSLSKIVWNVSFCDIIIGKHFIIVNIGTNGCKALRNTVH